MARDFHERPFDEGTLVKLSLYRDYLREWLPVFLRARERRVKTVNVFDFFAGPGRDVDGTSGSPLIAIEELAPYEESILNGELDLNIYFNEYDADKLQQLKSVMADLDVSQRPFRIHCSGDDFPAAFGRLSHVMSAEHSANFLFLDQSGIKQVTDSVFRQIIELRKTDFLFFISSSIVARFFGQPEISKHMPVPESKIEDTRYSHIHRLILDHFRSLVSEGEEYYLAPFSIRKGANVYGLIFGSGHIRGIEKFLKGCWKHDPQRGEANFDIDEEGIDPERPFLFRDMDKPSKLAIFEKALASAISSREVRTNKEIYRYALRRGFLPAHARKALKDMTREGKLPKQRLNISYDSCRVGVPEEAIRWH